MADPPLSNGSGGTNAKLAMMLRDCASFVERNDFSPIVYQTWGALNAYVKQHGAHAAPAAGGESSHHARVKTTTTTTHIPAPESSEASASSPTGEAGAVPENVFSADASADFDSGDAHASPFDESPPQPPKSSSSSPTTRQTDQGSVGPKSKDVFGFGGFSKKLSKQFGLHPAKNPSTDAEKRATSNKNANRLKSDLAADKTTREREGTQATVGITDDESTSPDHVKTTKAATSATSTKKEVSARPAFHRPSNPNTTLVANGWIEQHRRSRMRTVWKEVLASLVEGRTPKEETTLWIQREITNAQGKPELEALHQIPMKWLESVSYLDFYSDHRFCIKVFNVADEFQFRCADADSAQNWVLTLRSVSEIVQQKSTAPMDSNMKEVVGLVDDWEGTSTMSNHTERSGHKMSVKELQAIAHGAGYNTSGMERAELERLVTEISLKRSGSAAADMEEQRRRQKEEQLRRQQQQEEQRRRKQDPPASSGPPRKSIAELQSIAHGAGHNTSGMERAELEHLVASLSMDDSPKNVPQPHPPDPEAHQPRKGIAELRSIAHGAGYNTAGMERGELERLVAKIAADEANLQQQKDAALEAQRRRQHQAQEHAEAEKRRRQQEEEQRRLAAEAEQRRRQQQQEAERRRLAEQQAAEQRKKQEEEQRRLWQQQQAAAAEQRRRQEEEHRRRVAEQQAAEIKKREEEQRKRQEWERAQWQQQQAQQAAAQRAEWEKKWQQQQRQQHQQQQYTQQQAYRGQQTGAPPPPQGYQPPPPQPQPQGYQPPPPTNSAGYRPPPQPPPPPQNHPASPADMKYAKMADQSNDDAQVAITKIKRNLLLHWALQPPMNQMLRPIDVLITTIHTVFPPAFGVAAHDYFKKWTPISRDSIVAGSAMSGSPDEAKLKKAVRKLRFFLHPDKLPRDLNEEQTFMCKMLWDVTSDAMEEFHKRNEELGWIHN